jgi:1-deoxy-D-xylulose-5-phosphate reductoisomerase
MFSVCTLAAGTNLRLLRQQIAVFQPDLVSVLNEELARQLEAHLVNGRPDIVYGEDGLVQAATYPDVDMVVCAVVGAAGLQPLLAAIDAGKDIAVANKEPLVMAGEIIMQRARDRGVHVLPVDSEHSAVFQAMGGNTTNRQVTRIILTASGGPFYARAIEELKRVTPQEAVAHPVWRMGPKISVDSATLINKGLEIIEAHWFFGVPAEAIEVVIHPEGIVHSLVEFVDGSVIAQLSLPDMRLPIAYALAYPTRLPTGLPSLDLTAVGRLTFASPDIHKFPALPLAYQALEASGTMPAVFNAADETAVHAFLHHEISFDRITDVVAQTMSRHRPASPRGLEDILRVDDWARNEAAALIEERIR